MRFLSVCSGIEAASVALGPLGWAAAGFAEIDKAAARLLARVYGSNMPGAPLAQNGVPNHGDFTKIDVDALPPVDWLIGGTPCQAFSVAGRRLSLADARGNLALAYVVLAHELVRSRGLKGCLWENVPGVLNTRDNAFGCFLAALVGHDAAFPKPKWRGWPSAGMACGPRGRLAWRVLDAQHFGLAQRRARVFVVASFGDGPDPAQILFEPQGVPGDHSAGREAREGVAAPIAAGSPRSGGRPDTDSAAANLISYGVSPDCLDRSGEAATGTAADRSGLGVDEELAYALRAKRAGAVAYGGNAVLAHGQGGAELAFDACPTLTCNHEQPILFAPEIASTMPAGGNATGGARPPGMSQESAGGYLVAHAFAFKPSHFTRGKDGAPSGVAPPLSADADKGDQDAVVCAPIAFNSKQDGQDATDDLSPTLRAMGHKDSHANAGGQMAVAFPLSAGMSKSAAHMPQEQGALVPVAFDTTQITNKTNRSNPQPGAPCHALAAGADAPAIAFQDRFRGDDGRGYGRAPPVSVDQVGTLETVKPWNVAIEEPFTIAVRGRGDGRNLEHRQDGVANALMTPNGGRDGIGVGAVATQWAVRRLTPRECERLQGFPDDYTAIAGAADGPRYRQLGNSFAVPVVRWIGERIAAAAKNGGEQ